MVGSQILNYKQMITELMEKCSLVLAQTDVEKALHVVRENKKNTLKWSLKDSEVKDWQKTTAKRIRTMLRHVNQAFYKSPTAEWFMGLALGGTAAAARKRPASAAAAAAAEAEDDEAGEDDEEPEEESEEEEEEEEEEDEEADEVDKGKDKSPSSGAKSGGRSSGAKSGGDESIIITENTSFFVGYDKGTRTAWRAPHKKPKQKELAVEVKKRPGSAATDPPVACFRDGENFLIAGMTCEELDGELASVSRHPSRKKPKSSAIKPLWEGVAPDGAAVKVQWRKDRPWVISIFKAKLQICQVKPISWELPGKAADKKDEALGDLMVAVAKQWCGKKIEEIALFEYRDGLLSKEGFEQAPARRRPAAAKRPAAAADEDGETAPPAAKAKRPAAAASAPPAAKAETAPPAARHKKARGKVKKVKNAKKVAKHKLKLSKKQVKKVKNVTVATFSMAPPPPDFEEDF